MEVERDGIDITKKLNDVNVIIQEIVNIEFDFYDTTPS